MDFEKLYFVAEKVFVPFFFTHAVGKIWFNWSNVCVTVYSIITFKIHKFKDNAYNPLKYNFLETSCIFWMHGSSF